MDGILNDLDLINLIWVDDVAKVINITLLDCEILKQFLFGRYVITFSLPRGSAVDEAINLTMRIANERNRVQECNVAYNGPTINTAEKDD